MSTGKEMHVTAAGAYEHVLNELIPVFARECGISIRLTVANAAGVFGGSRPGRLSMSSLHLRLVSITSSRAVSLTGQAAWKSGACALASRFSRGCRSPT